MCHVLEKPYPDGFLVKLQRIFSFFTGYLRAMFTVEDIDEMVSRLTKHGAQLVGEVVQYENSYRLCYIRGTEGLLIGLAEEIGNK